MNEPDLIDGRGTEPRERPTVGHGAGGRLAASPSDRSIPDERDILRVLSALPKCNQAQGPRTPAGVPLPSAVVMCMRGPAVAAVRAPRGYMLAEAQMMVNQSCVCLW